MIRLHFKLRTTQQWYELMRECRQWFGSNWRCQPRVRRKLSDEKYRHVTSPQRVWFEVPDERFASWVAVKMALEVASDSKLNTAK
jgi:hypothetical protein